MRKTLSTTLNLLELFGWPSQFLPARPANEWHKFRAMMCYQIFFENLGTGQRKLLEKIIRCRCFVKVPAFSLFYGVFRRWIIIFLDSKRIPVPQNAYLPDVSPFTFFLFRRLNNHLKGTFWDTWNYLNDGNGFYTVQVPTLLSGVEEPCPGLCVFPRQSLWKRKRWVVILFA